MNSPKNPNLRNHLLAISASLLIGAGLITIKFLAFYLTGSAAIPVSYTHLTLPTILLV